MKRAVADSNVLVSALQFGGKPMAFLTLAEEGQIDLAISEAILTETLGVLRVKFHNTPEQLADREAYLRTITRMVSQVETLRVVANDPDDDKVIECAVAADAETVVSGDTDLLGIGSFRGIRIQKVSDFLAGFHARGR